MTNLSNPRKKILVAVSATFFFADFASAADILVSKTAEVEEIKRAMSELESDLENAILKNRIKELSENPCCYHTGIMLKNEEESSENSCCHHAAILLAQEKKTMEYKMALLGAFKTNNLAIIEILTEQSAFESRCCDHSATKTGRWRRKRRKIHVVAINKHFCCYILCFFMKKLSFC
ncbi:MAG: hypothetical protein LBB29_01850 [Holosporaceae bacterium]|jgi:hypothetical protein|nr:hypothetical protein [Holosporaceae bacterium]